jgi:hypothetical protein
MKITIQGQDYTAALDASRTLTVERKLNEPSMCELWLSLPASNSLPEPARYQTLSICGDNGTTYFTGYIAVSPMIEYAGVGLEGPRYRITIQAVSDERILDQLPMPPSAGSSGETAGALIASLVTHSGSTALSAQELTLNTSISSFVPAPGTNWSQRAGQIANMARATYRALNAALTLTPVQAQVHPLSETDGTLNLANLSFTASVKRGLANDVTVCGEDEPVAYVTEYFLGDGITTTFNLAADPYSLSSAKARIIKDLFNEARIDETMWSVSGGQGYLGLGPAGLAMNGGNGIDGQTALTWIDAVEMGGTLLLEASGVILSPGSTGVVAGFFSGGAAAADCIVGFQVIAQQGTGAVTLQPLIQGCAAGTTFPVNPENSYTLRVRVHCPEIERSRASYYSFGDGGPISAGGQEVLAPCSIQMEVQQFVNGIGATPVTVYSGSLANLPGACQVVPASSINLIGSMRAFSLNNPGSGWVVSTPPNGTAYTRRIGTTAEQAECHVESSGKLVFYTGYVPVAGEQIAVSYRTVGRAVGRAVNAASQTALAQAGSPSVAAWIGSVTSPAARSSTDCRNAALVMEQAAASVSALWSGNYKGFATSFATDVWPGDALQLNVPSANLNTQVVVRTVKLSYVASYPDLVTYDVMFANDWADDLAIKTSTRVPEDTWLPAPIAPTVLENLNGLTVTTLNGSAVTLNTGVTPPSGGGFEIRLRDFAFMAGDDSALVMRGSQQALTFSRVSAADRFYIRMYDGSTPPNYSEFSAAVFINLPLSS